MVRRIILGLLAGGDDGTRPHAQTNKYLPVNDEDNSLLGQVRHLYVLQNPEDNHYFVNIVVTSQPASQPAIY